MLGESVQATYLVAIMLIGTALLFGGSPNVQSIEESPNARPLPTQIVVLPAASIINTLLFENRLHVLLPGATLDGFLVRDEFVDPSAKKEIHSAAGVEIVGPSPPIPVFLGELDNDPGSFVQVMVLTYGFNVMYRSSHQLGDTREYSFLESATKEGAPTNADTYQWSSRSLGPASQNEQPTPELFKPLTLEDCSNPMDWQHEDVYADGDATFKLSAGSDWEQHQNEEVGSAAGVFFDYACIRLSIHGNVYHTEAEYNSAQCDTFRTQVQTHWETLHIGYQRMYTTALTAKDLYTIQQDGSFGYGTAGCAIVAGCCYPAKATSYAVLEWTEPVSGFDSLRRLTLNAHEPGHLYNARHEDDPAYSCIAGGACPCGPTPALVKCRIMSATYLGASGNEAAFGPVAANAIKTYATAG